jgi:hypothetical protein
MVPMLIINSSVPHEKWVFTSPTVTLVTLYRVRWMNYQTKNYVGRKVIVFGSCLLFYKDMLKSSDDENQLVFVFKL